ncbi:MAG: hypothetical protein HN929_01105 [Chloroflexi bacterium]|jgi:hypothetical protein|nr:hypothetical protein [Chloroflexota bacterium]MBT7080062.1 hypothetical protein [Chloroflexota bacterium]MBT7289775.1 hypothetical protein [Chloroflexota bacterium]
MEPHKPTTNLNCPECGQASIRKDKTYNIYSCNNPNCKAVFSEKDYVMKTVDAHNADSKASSVPAKGKPVVGTQYFDTQAGRWKQMKSKNITFGDLLSITAILGAIALGLAGAALGGTIWYFFTILTGWQIGFVVVVVGWLVGYCVVYGAGQKRARILQYTSVVLTIIALFIGEYLILRYYYNEVGGEGWMTLGYFFTNYFDNLTSGYRGILDIIFFALAIWYAYRLPSPSMRR